MKERIFIISPLPEDEEEENFPYDKHGNTTAMAYYDERGSTIDTDYQEQPEPETTIEKHITIIYEAPKTKVIDQETEIAKFIASTPRTEENIQTIFSQPETIIEPTQIEPDSSKNHLYRYYPSLTQQVYEQSKEDYLAGKELPQPHEPYERLLNFFPERPDPLLNFFPERPDPLLNFFPERPDPLLNFFSRQAPIEENQLTSIRSELATLTPAAQTGEIAAAA